MKVQFSTRWLFAITLVVAVVLFASTPVEIELFVEEDFLPDMEQVNSNETIYACTGFRAEDPKHVECKLIEIFEVNESVLVRISRYDWFRVSKSSAYSFSYHDNGLPYWSFPHLDN